MEGDKFDILVPKSTFLLFLLHTRLFGFGGWFPPQNHPL